MRNYLDELKIFKVLTLQMLFNKLYLLLCKWFLRSYIYIGEANLLYFWNYLRSTSSASFWGLSLVRFSLVMSDLYEMFEHCSIAGDVLKPLN